MTDPLRAVIAGCGGISQAWLKPVSTMEDVEIVGMVDLLTENAHKRAGQFGLSNVEIGDNLVRVLDNTRPDVVFDCTVPEAHMDVTLEALALGCHVLGEKPLSDTLENARRMVAAAKSSGRLYAVMQNRRYSQYIRALKDYLNTGEIGPLTTINSDFFLAPHFGGFRDQMRHVLLLDMAIHTFDEARFLSGANPVSVYCKEWNPAGSWYTHGASAVAVFELEQPGSVDPIIYTYRGSWCAEGLPTNWDSDWRLVGTCGTARWDGEAGLSAAVVAAAGGFQSQHRPGVIAPYVGPKAGGHAAVIRDFVDCLRTGRTPETICTDNIRSLAMVFGAIESAEGGAPVRITD